MRQLKSDQSQRADRIAATDAILKTIRDTARHQLTHALGSHDWEHTLRVHRLCCKIGPQEDADMLVLEAAAFLHDIGRPQQDEAKGSVCHAVAGAQLAARILASLALDEERKQNIVHCVRAHRFRDDHSPATNEARILFDADKLDAIGAVGIARAYLFAGELGACLHNGDIAPETAEPYSRNDTGYREYVVKLSKIKDRMITPTGRRMAEARNRFMVSFFQRFIEEYEGIC